VAELTTELTLEGSVEDADLPTLAQQLASLYGVPVSSLSLSLSSGSIVLLLTILSESSNASALASVFASVDDSALSASLGSTVHRSGEVQLGFQNQTVSVNSTVMGLLDCPHGHCETGRIRTHAATTLHT
jgi:hypothetical protein